MGKIIRYWFRRIPPEEMGTGPPVRTLIIMAIPAAAAGVFQTLYELVDGLFISHLGKEQISGVSLVAPVFMVAYALAMPVSIGISALASRHLGADRQDDARDVVNHGLTIAAVVGGLLSLLGPLATEVLVAALSGAGAGGDKTAQTIAIEGYATQYLAVILYAAVLLHVGIAAESSMRAQGNTVTPMIIMGAGNVANILLDWLLIFGLDLGVRGAALATVISRSAMSLALLIALCHRESRLRPGRVRRRALFGRWDVLAEIYWLGLPPSISIMGMSIAVLLVNRIIIDLNEIAIGVQGIGWRLEAFAFIPIFGMFSAVVPMIGYNLGAGLHRRCRQVVVGACIVASASMGAVGAVLFAFPVFFLRQFGNDPEIISIGVKYLRINTIAYPLIGSSIMLSAGFVGLGKSYLSMICNLFRTLVLRVPLAWALAGAAALTGVWWSYPLSSTVAFLLALVLMQRLLGRIALAEPRMRRPARRRPGRRPSRWRRLRSRPGPSRGPAHRPRRPPRRSPTRRTRPRPSRRPIRIARRKARLPRTGNSHAPCILPSRRQSTRPRQ